MESLTCLGLPVPQRLGLLALLAHLLLPVAPGMPFPPWLALPWGLADTLDVPPSSLWVPLGEQHATATLLEGKVPEGGALCLSHSLCIPQILEGCSAHRRWSVVSGPLARASRLQLEFQF